MQISVYATKNADRYRVLLDGEVVTGWIEADDTAGTVTRDVPATDSGGARFMRREVARGVVVIRKPKIAKQAGER